MNPGTAALAIGFVAVLACSAGGAPPAASSDYERVIAARAEKIVGVLDGASAETREGVRELLLDFSRATNAWHDDHGTRRQELRKAQSDEAKGELAKLEEELAAIRSAFVERLAAILSPEEVDRVKDGLTYDVLHVTERAYREMIPSLTADERTRIHDWLVEARDLAIGEGSSEAKHAVFGRSKGRINNFLSEHGYDLKAEERGWQARRKAAAEAAGSKEPH